MAPSVERRDLNGKILEMKIPTDMEMGVGLIEIEGLSSKSPSKHCLAFGQMIMADCCLLLDHSCLLPITYCLIIAEIYESKRLLILNLWIVCGQYLVFFLIFQSLKLKFFTTTKQCCYGALGNGM